MVSALPVSSTMTVKSPTASVSRFRLRIWYPVIAASPGSAHEIVTELWVTSETVGRAGLSGALDV